MGVLTVPYRQCHLKGLPALVSAASDLQSNTKNTNMAYSILFHFAQPNRKHFYSKGDKIIQQIVEGATIIKFILSETCRIQDTPYFN